MGHNVNKWDERTRKVSAVRLANLTVTLRTEIFLSGIHVVFGTSVLQAKCPHVNNDNANMIVLSRQNICCVHSHSLVC